MGIVNILPVGKVQMYISLPRWKRIVLIPTSSPSFPPFKTLMNEKISKLQAFQHAAFGLAKLASWDHHNVFDAVKTELPLSYQRHGHVSFMNLNWHPVQSLLAGGGRGAGSTARQQLVPLNAVFSRSHRSYGVLITGVADQCCSLKVFTQICKKDEEFECWVVGTLKRYLSSAVVQALVSSINETPTPCPGTVDWILRSLCQCFSTSLSLPLYCPLPVFCFPWSPWLLAFLYNTFQDASVLWNHSWVYFAPLFSGVLDGYW